MTDPADAPGKSGLPMIGWLLVFVLVVYPLSVGPAVKIFGGRLPDALDAFYAPLKLLYDNVPAVAAFYDLYFKLLGIR